MPRPAMSGAEPCTGSNSEGKRRSGLMFPAGAMPIVGGAEVGKDVAEQIGRHDDVEPIGMLDEMRGQDVDMIFIPTHAGIMLRHRFDTFVPIGHRYRNAVGLGRRSQMVLFPPLREVEGIFQDPVGADPRHDRFLHDDFTVRVRKNPAADRRIFAFGIFADDIEIDVAGLAARKRARHTRHEFDRPKIDILVELSAKLDQRTPKRYMVGHALGPTDGAEEDRVMPANLLLPVAGHHRAVLQIIIA